MKTLIFVVSSFFSITVFSQKDELFLTPTNKYGDCVSSRIFTKPTTKKQKELVAKSVQEGVISSDSKGYNIDSIIAYCGDNNDYIGINDKTLILKRIGKRPDRYSYFIGNYTAGNYKVKVKKIRVISTEYFDETSKSEENIMSYSCEVLITITKGTIKQQFLGRTSEGI